MQFGFGFLMMAGWINKKREDFLFAFVLVFVAVLTMAGYESRLQEIDTWPYLICPLFMIVGALAAFYSHRHLKNLEKKDE